MTSVIRRYDQQPARTRYLIAIQTPDFDSSGSEQWLLSDVSSYAFYLPPTTSSESQFSSSLLIADVSLGSINASPGTILQGELYLDLGRSLHVYDGSGAFGTYGLKLCTFRQVMKQRDFTSEGTCNSILWVKTWSAESSHATPGPPYVRVFVARAG